MSTRFSNPDGDTRGAWSSGDPYSRGAGAGNTQHPGVYGIQHPLTGEMMYPPPGKHWYYGRDRMFEIFTQWGNYRQSALTACEVAERRRIAGDDVRIREDVLALVIYDWESSHATAVSVYEAGNWPEYYPTRKGLGGFRRKVYRNRGTNRY